MLRSPIAGLGLLIGLTWLNIAAAVETDYAKLLREVRAARRALRVARRATASIVADPGIALVVSPFVVCPTFPGTSSSQCALQSARVFLTAAQTKSSPWRTDKLPWDVRAP